MYDFYFGDAASIDQNPWKWLLSIKRMLPRWLNGIPDSEYEALYNLLLDMEQRGLPEGKNLMLAETGCGASTIILLYFALRWDARLFSWDISSNKQAYLRGLLTDTLFRHVRTKSIYDHWAYIPYNSTDAYAGIPVIGELNGTICACFFDSDHTWKTLGREVKLIVPYLADGGLVCIDDGNYTYETSNTAYINMLRTKLGLPRIDIQNNQCKPFWEMTEAVLKQHFPEVQNLEGGTYRSTFTEDIFFEYYSSDRQNAAALGMEKLEELSHRFDAWKVSLEK